MRTAYQSSWLSLSMSTLLVFSLIQYGPTFSEGSIFTGGFFSFLKQQLKPTFLLVSKFTHLKNFNSEAGGTFCYDDPSCGPKSDEWPGICQTGKEQSPVALPYNPFIHNVSAQYNLALDSKYSSPQAFILKNNGHTVQASLQKDLSSTSSVEGTLLGGKYIFSQLHFHWGSSDIQGSEHILNGNPYPIEVHLVHYNAKYDTFTQALTSKETGAVAVIGRMFQISKSNGREIDSIVKSLKQVQAYNTSINANDLNIGSYLKPLSRRKVDTIQYNGSLTTPGCNEGVLWTIIPQPLKISKEQLRAFRSLSANKEGTKQLVNNYRPLQQRGDRQYVASQTRILKSKIHHAQK